MDLAGVRDFLFYLRSRGFSIGVDKFAAVETMLVVLSANGVIGRFRTGDLTPLGRYIAPIVCLSAAQQRLFHAELHGWLAAGEATWVDAPSPREAIEGAQTRRTPASVDAGPVASRVAWPVSKIAVGLSAVTAISAGLGHWITAVGCGVAAAGAHYGSRAWQARLVSVRRSVRYSPLADGHRLLAVSNAHVPALFRGPKTLAAMRSIRHVGEYASDEDERMKGDAHGLAWLTLLSNRRLVESRQGGLLVLSNHRSYQDQLADVIDDLVGAIREQGVPVEYFRYFRDAGVLYRVDRGRERVLLKSAAQRYPHHMLIVASDGSEFVDSVSGRLKGWFNGFRDWDHRILLVPPHVAAAGPPAAVRSSGFATSTTDAISLVRLLSAMGAAAYSEWAAVGALRTHARNVGYPPLLDSSWHDWLLPTPPDDATLDRLITELKEYLGAETFQGMATCAIYPLLAWPLTKYLVSRVSRSIAPLEGTNDEALQAIASLPWFRGGTMPTYLRERLLTELSPRAVNEARAALTSLFELAIARERDTFELSLMLPANTFQTMLQRLLRAQVKEWSPVLDKQLTSILRSGANAVGRLRRK